MKSNNIIAATFGTHAARTPISYVNYQRCFEKFGLTLDNTSKEPDILISGFHIDIPAEQEKINEVRKLNPNVKIFIISEEPLWDLTWHDNPFVIKQNCKTTGLEYFYINHYSCDAFNIAKVPYFLTTESKYITRYTMLMAQFEKLTSSDLLTHWNNSNYLISCFVEKRADKKYDVTKNGFQTHSNLRSIITEDLLDKEYAQVHGKGWNNDKPRQLLPDWHVDKLSKTYKQSKYVMAIENTDAPSYITEKVFDAFCSLSIPVVVKRQVGELEKLLINPAVFEVDNIDISLLSGKLNEFKPTKIFAEQYLSNLRQLMTIFRNVDNLKVSVNTYSKSLTRTVKNFCNS